MTYPGQNPHRHRRMVLLALAALLVVAGGAVGVTHWLDSRSAHPRDPTPPSPTAAAGGQLLGCDVTVHVARAGEGIKAGACLLSKIAESQWKPTAVQLQVLTAAAPNFGDEIPHLVVPAPAGAAQRTTTPLGTIVTQLFSNPSRINLYVGVVYQVQWLQGVQPKTQWCVLGSEVTQGTQWGLALDTGVARSDTGMRFYCQAQKPDPSTYSKGMPR